MPKIVSVSQRRKDSLSWNCLKSWASSLNIAVITRLSALSCSIRAFFRSEYRTGRERLLLVLHVGYAFVPIGFLLNASSAFGIVPTGAGVHAWMAGAAGVMTLAVMSRASLGHTGQQLTASAATQGIYVAIVVAALARICAVLEPVGSLPLLYVAAFGWAAAFLGFALSYGPTLIGFDKHLAQRPVSA
jgi:uncharacterized protein involved in response to NO